MRNEPVALVTGAGGFIGTHLCRLLASRGEPFVGTLSPRGHEPALGLTSQPAALFRSIDLQDSIAVRDLVAEVAPTRIFNLAAVGTHPLERYDPFAYVELNVRLPAALFQFMPRGCILVHVGSMKQYTGCVATLSEDTASRDSSTLYSWSKNAADSLLETLERSSAEKSSSVVRVRLFSVTGGGEPEQRLLASLVKSYLDSTDVSLSDGNQIRDLLHVEDAVSALAHVSNCTSLVGQAVNIARGEGRTVRWIAERAAERLACQDRVRFGAIPRRADEPRQQLVADVSRLRSTGWRPQWSYEESIDRALNQMIAGGTAPF